MVKYQKSLTSRILLCIGVTPIAVIVTITMIYGIEICTKYFYVGVKPFMKLIKNFRSYFFKVFITSSTPTPWLTLHLVLGKSGVKQNSCSPS